MTVYVVMRGLWNRDEFSSEDEFSEVEESGVPVAVFFTEEEASAALDAMERQAQEEVSSPFLVGGTLEERSGLNEEDFVREVRKLGLPAPKVRSVSRSSSEVWNWPAWYDGLDPRPTPEQLQGLWNLLDGLCFFKIVEVEADEDFDNLEWDETPR
jgi:hypothetical protein